MPIICPTITAYTPEEFAYQNDKVKFAPRAQIDITDGVLAPSHTINLNQVYFNEGQTIDLHLMIQKPTEWLEMAIALHPNMIVVHAEAELDFVRVAEHIKKFGIKFGVAILPETTVEQVRDKIIISDHVLIFGGHLGYQGGQADLTQADKVKEIRQLSPGIEIGWDGGANESNVTELSQQGIDVINVGSAIMKSETPEETYKNLSRLARFS